MIGAHLAIRTVILICAIQFAGAATGLCADDSFTLIADGLSQYPRDLVSLSPDGSTVACIRGDQLLLQRLEDVPVFPAKTVLIPSLHTGKDGKKTKNLFSIAGWDHAGKAVLFSVVESNASGKILASKTYLFSMNGELEELASSNGRYGCVGKCHLTIDGAHLVFVDGARPLIWDVKSNRPKATPFEKLVPSPTSKRWIGIEKDTRQLVYVKEPWGVIERTPFFFPNFRWGKALHWSDDERFILVQGSRAQIHRSKPTQNVWLDLVTEERYEFPVNGDYGGREVIQFVGQDGEFATLGVIQPVHNRATNQAVPGSYVEFRKPPMTPMERPWRWESRWSWGSLSLPVCSDDAAQFAVVNHQLNGLVLLNRDKLRTKLPLPDRATPQRILGFVLGGKALLVICQDRLLMLDVPSGERQQ